MNQDQVEQLERRHRVIDAWEKKYGEPAPRVITNFLLVAPPEQIVRRFGGKNPGPYIPPQAIGKGIDTAALDVAGEATAWTPLISYEDEYEPWYQFAGDPKSLTEKMVPVYREAFKRVRGREPTAAELELVMAVGRGESHFGTAKYPGGLGPGMHNHGAIQCHSNCTEANSFPSWDTHPNDDGSSTRYDQRFRRYGSPEEGAAALIKTVGNDPLRMLKEYDNLLPAFSLGMYGNHYYEMFNASPSKIKEHQATYDWIRSHAERYPSGVSDWFKKGMKRAKDPIPASRVLMHSIALNRHADSNAKALGVERATTMTPSMMGGREVLGAAAGGLLGMSVGGPFAGFLGGVTGYFAGRATR
jgi:hypothetical protein